MNSPKANHDPEGKSCPQLHKGVIIIRGSITGSSKIPLPENVMDIFEKAALPILFALPLPGDPNVLSQSFPCAAWEDKEN